MTQAELKLKIAIAEALQGAKLFPATEKDYDLATTRVLAYLFNPYTTWAIREYLVECGFDLKAH